MIGAPIGRREALQALADRCIADVEAFSRLVVRRPLYPYQLEAARGIFRHVKGGLRNAEFVVMMSRQAGKNEMSAQTEAHQLTRNQKRGGTIVKCAPTEKPQIITSKNRLIKCLDNFWTKGKWKSREGYIYSLGAAQVMFFSADPQSNVVGATADLYMEVDEAQDVQEVKYDKDFAPMRATTNAPVVFYGTAWTKDTLLAKYIRHCEDLEKVDGIKRTFIYPWHVVAEYNPAYGAFVEAQIDRLGKDHPIILTQYELKEIDQYGAFLSDAQRESLVGGYLRRRSPGGAYTYAMGIDVAGESEMGTDELLRNLAPRKDSTVITIVRFDWSQWHPLFRHPAVQIVDHVWWTGHDHRTQYIDMARIIQRWNPLKVVIDGGGVGAGLASFMKSRFGSRIEVFSPNGTTVSKLGYHFLSLVNTGRIKMYREDGEQSPEAKEFWFEMGHAQREMKGQGLMNFFLPENVGHDDYLKSTALAAWSTRYVLPPASVGEEKLLERRK